MKSLIPLLIAVSAVLLVSSCKKSDPVAPEYKLEGKWTGTYTNLGGGTPNYFALSFQSNGVLLVQANDATTPDIANGLYHLDTDSLRGSFVYAVGIGVNYLFAAKYNPSSNVMTGTFGVRPYTASTGVFTVTRQQ
jgi:hypothetical protein